MRRMHLLGMTALLFGQLGFADSTFVSGAVSGNWTREGSPYIVEDYLIVETGDSLSIGPGVRVYFAGPYLLQLDSAASLRVIGAEGDSVVFTGRTDADSLRWAGIYSRYSADTLRFEYCVVENATGQESHAALEVQWSDGIIEHSSFRRNVGRDGRDVHGGALSILDGQSQQYTVAIRDCAFDENAGNHGGALSLYDATGEMERCVFRNNRAGSGGAVYAFLCPTRIDSCEFFENRAEGSIFARGGAIWFEGHQGQLKNCIFSDNHAREMGGAIANPWGGSGPDVGYEGCWFSRNTTDSLGGALALGDEERVKKCVFDSNIAPNGGALFYSVGYVLTVTQCTFVNNVATVMGAAIGSSTSLNYNLRLVNCAIAYNSGNPAIYRSDCAPSYFRNNAFWGNDSLFGFDQCSSRHAVQYVNGNGDSCDADDNIYLDPLFENWELGDFRPMEDSPLIDAGIAAPIFETTNDPDGTPPDIGAFFFDQRSAGEERPELPRQVSLSQNYPNPFNAETTIEFSLPMTTQARLELFDITGRQVRTLFDEVANGRNSVHVSMDGLASGIYVYRLATPGLQVSKKMLFLK